MSVATIVVSRAPRKTSSGQDGERTKIVMSISNISPALHKAASTLKDLV